MFAEELVEGADLAEESRVDAGPGVVLELLTQTGNQQRFPF
jgi:hypothetical protein